MTSGRKARTDPVQNPRVEIKCHPPNPAAKCQQGASVAGLVPGVRSPERKEHSWFKENQGFLPADHSCPALPPLLSPPCPGHPEPSFPDHMILLNRDRMAHSPCDNMAMGCQGLKGSAGPDVLPAAWGNRKSPSTAGRVSGVPASSAWVVLHPALSSLFQFVQIWAQMWVGKIPWRREWHLLQCSCLKSFMDRGAWWATVHGVAESRTRPSN